MGAAITLNSLAKTADTTKTAATATTKTGGGTFQEVMQKTKAADKPQDIFTEIQSMQKNLMSGKEFNPKDLILYQIKAGQFNMRVEMLSKVAEGAVSTFKKFQNPQ